MSGDENANLIYGLICVMLLISSLAARRLPFKQTAKMLLAWVAIFAGLFALFLFRGEFSEIWNRAKADFAGNSEIASDGTMRIKKDEDGHFNVRASVNGKEIDFLIDTGATVTTLNSRDAADANIEVDSGFPVIVQTAALMGMSLFSIRINLINIIYIIEHILCRSNLEMTHLAS